MIDRDDTKEVIFAVCSELSTDPEKCRKLVEGR